MNDMHHPCVVFCHLLSIFFRDPPRPAIVPQGKQGIDDFGIELGSLPLMPIEDGGFHAPGVLTRPAMRQGVEHIDGGDGSRRQRDIFAIKTLRISAAIDMLVVVAGDLRAESQAIVAVNDLRRLFQDLLAHAGMPFHELAFFRSMLARLEQHAQRKNGRPGPRSHSRQPGPAVLP